MENNMNTSIKEYVIFASIIIAFTLILSVTIIFTNEIGQNKLQNEIKIVLDEKETGVWTVGEYVRLKSTFALNASCFKVTKNNTEDFYAIIMRIETMYGPFPCVFVCDKKNNAQFIGISNLHGKIQNILENGLSLSQIAFWENRISKIISYVEDSNE